MDIKATLEAVTADLEKAKADASAAESLANEASASLATVQAEKAATEKENAELHTSLANETALVAELKGKLEAAEKAAIDAKNEAEASKQAALENIAGSGNAPISTEATAPKLTKNEARAEFDKLWRSGDKDAANAIWKQYCEN